MKVLRLLLIVALTLSVPALGQASSGVDEQCRMMPGTFMAHDTLDQHDCDVIAKAPSSKPDSRDTCPAMQNCAVGAALYLSTSSLSLRTSRPVRIVALLPDTPTVFRAPDGLWRPPRLI
ncbi:hypothetical protein [Phytohalomonas tamaricis]|uniref:hypothetical protein n=1 Tax=Phytohalomonas tamaricis TaxID=2081032 RepID=UPI001319D5B9|nr:hypothetical protein [Phytohalomonas tamaricis]